MTTARPFDAMTMSPIIKIVDGDDLPRGTLDALGRQVDAPPLQILAPHDDSRAITTRRG